MLVTNDADLAARANVLRNHGASISEEQRHHGPQPYLLAAFDELGFNYRMTDLQAAIGIVQLGKLDGFVEERDRWARFYREQLADIEWLHHPTAAERRPPRLAGLCDLCRSQARTDAAQCHHGRAASHAGRHATGYPCGAHVRLLSRALRLRADDLPGARDCERNTMAIPLHNRMTEDDYDYVVDCLRDIARSA